jgi:hypothetical protein
MVDMTPHKAMKLTSLSVTSFVSAKKSLAAVARLSWYFVFFGGCV